jgi:hypothetical protein
MRAPIDPKIFNRDLAAKFPIVPAKRSRHAAGCAPANRFCHRALALSALAAGDRRAAVAELVLDVDESAGLFEGYELKLNSYDLGVDIELHDAMQRLRFEHPEAKAVILRSGKPRVFSAGANIRMLAGARRP